MSSLFPALSPAPSGARADRPALRFGERSLTYAELAAAAGASAGRIGAAGRVAVWARPALVSGGAGVGGRRGGGSAVALHPMCGGQGRARL
ncbi:acyl-CoA synthetase, partial [Streptomyces olivaceus]